MSTVTSTTNSAASSLDPTKSSSTQVKEQTDRFLKLLLTQLQNQNPMDPMKPEQFASQLAQYSQLEQQVQSNSKLDKILTAVSTPITSPLSYLGSTIDYNSTTAPVQQGKAAWTYDATGAAAVTLTVKDASGKIVYTGEGLKTPGEHILELPFASLGNGTPLTLSVAASNTKDEAVTANITARAKVDGVDTSSAAALLLASGFSINTGDVKRISTATAASTATTTPTTTATTTPTTTPTTPATTPTPTTNSSANAA